LEPQAITDLLAAGAYALPDTRQAPREGSMCQMRLRNSDPPSRR